MRELFKKAAQNSMYGRRMKRMLGFKVFALAMLMVIGVAFAGSAYSSGDPAVQVTAAIAAVAPLAFVIPKDLGLSEDDEKGLKALAEYLSKQLSEYQKGLIESEDLNKKVREAFETFAKDCGIEKDKFKKIEDALKEQGIEIRALKEGKPDEIKPFREHLKTLFSKENVDKVIGNRAPGMVGIEMKAATTITTANASAHAPHALSFEILPGIREAPRETPVILSALSKGTTNSRTIIWLNRVNEEGGAAFIAEGALKPLKDWEYKEENSTAKKIAVSAKVSSEMLHDFSYMESEIRLLLTRDLYQMLDNKLLNGTGSTDPTGIITGAGGYAGTGLDGMITMPNNADALRAAMLQMRLLNFRPDVAFLNPTDAAVMDLTKSSTGNYIKIELEGVLRSLRIIETTEITAGDFLLMDTAKWIVRILEDFRLEFGWVNDDFQRNLITIIAELRLHSYQNSVDAGSVIYDTFDTVKTALEVA
jgi:HK97 family phage major capsid protein